ncbi:N-formylglutamate deformylase [Mesorhizobium mediterraneum]|uniref:N-formylglutamate deformylase n=1 Tax=Mesorhizobium mediterraneum TaxID=43617 RepID=A0AB36R7Z7_9HYPH|nr:N-formylglutamate deformylase [Mesorhizobium mediterraneum]PAQ01028.1 N-formylglutamate deformylase [Mesorhizobium mediterraneum]RWN41062.1 MAG: N-formylglutamate deformylase [Mesorhizobium sp.]TIT32683.1 MAG: N-formylglutamate deformylase [Mesorhizobium sp.]WIW52186.1 N-formylglutamate deformylase [Mesorhizobium mediterraneum]
MTAASWLTVTQGTAPLLVSIPHTGIDLAGLENRLVSPWLGRRDADWWIDKLYDFAESLGATVVHTAISRTVIDVNRDPSGASLYPGQATTGLCPTETFDGDPLYRAGEEPGPSEVDERREKYFVPYHAALQAEIDRLRALHQKVVLYDCHSIRSVLPRLFEGTLPVFNLGTNDGKSADPALQAMVGQILAETGETFVINGRFKGGWITRHFGQPQNGVYALQMELSNRGYMREPEGKGAPDNWPVSYDADFAAPIRVTLKKILENAIVWAHG